MHQGPGRSFTVGVLLLGVLIGPLAAQQQASFPLPARPVAPIVSPGWTTEAARDREGESSKVFDYLGLEPGIRVADIGAGSGYYTVRLAQRLGPRSVIYGEDIDEAYLGRLQARLEHEKVRGVTLVLGAASDPELPPASVDLALMSHMYHEIANPYEFLYNLAPAIAPGGRVAVVDVDRQISRHGTPASLLKCEMGAMGYQERGIQRLDGDSTYVAVFDVPAHPTPPGQIKVCRPTK
ncbi:MAG TPA: methyltransferase domain-containing protein [Gemmatimonadales bacterium]|nr:methyltransferase domain-containing protein [Gemmatimonadales bacterium]